MDAPPVRFYSLLLGDKTFPNTDRYNVADNEAFVAYLVEFLADTDRDGGGSGDDAEDDTESGDGRPAGNDSGSGSRVTITVE